MRNGWVLVSVATAIGVGYQMSGAHGIPPTSGEKAAAGAKAKYADVQKIFNEACIRCHGDGRPRGGINLTSYENVMKGGEDGPIVKAGDPAASVLYKAITGNGARQMPPRGPKIADAKIKTVEAWIKAGAKK